MKIIQDVPTIIYNAILAQQAKYSKGDADISVTELIRPTRQYILMQEYADRIEKKASDMIKMLKGSALDHIIEMGADDDYIVKTRHIKEMCGWKISGEFDAFEIPTKTLYDWKEVNVWEYVFGTKLDKVLQLNIYAWLFSEMYRIEKLKLGFVYSNWERKKAVTTQGYPQKEILTQEVEFYSVEQTEKYIAEKLFAIEQYLHSQRIPDCTDEDRWYRGEKWAVMKHGKKRAEKLFDNAMEAAKMANEGGFYVEHRKGEYARCELYCDVYEFCEQAQEAKNV